MALLMMINNSLFFSSKPRNSNNKKLITKVGGLPSYVGKEIDRIDSLSYIFLQQQQKKDSQ